MQLPLFDESMSLITALHIITLITLINSIDCLILDQTN